MRRVHADVGEESSHPTMLTLASADRGVAQPGQSIGLQNRGPEVRILTPLPLSSRSVARGAVDAETPDGPREPSSALLMAAIKTINLPYRCVDTTVTNMN